MPRRFVRSKGTKRGKSRGSGANASAPGVPFGGTKRTPPRPKPASAGSGARATAPGQLKKAAGVQSARSFAPGQRKAGVPSAARPVPGTPPSAGPSTPQRPSRPVPPSVGSGGTPARGTGPASRGLKGGSGTGATNRGSFGSKGGGARMALQPTGAPKPYGKKSRPGRRTS